MHLANLPVHLSVCPIQAYNSKTKIHRKIKFGTNVPQGMSKWSSNFQLKRSKVKVTGRQKPPEVTAYLAHVYLWAADHWWLRH